MTPQPLINGTHVNRDDSLVRADMLFMPVGRNTFDTDCDMALRMGCQILMSDWVHPGKITPYPYDDSRLKNKDGSPKHGRVIEPFESTDEIVDRFCEYQTGAAWPHHISFAIHTYPNTTGLFADGPCPGVTYANPPEDWSEILVSAYAGYVTSDDGQRVTIENLHQSEYTHLRYKNEGIRSWDAEFRKVGAYYGSGKSMRTGILNGVWGAWGTKNREAEIGDAIFYLPTVSTGFMLRDGSEYQARSAEELSKFVCACEFAYFYKDGFSIPNNIGENAFDHANREYGIINKYRSGWNGITMYGGLPTSVDQANRRNVLTDALTVEAGYGGDFDKWFDAAKAYLLRIDKPSNPFIYEFGWIPLYLNTKAEDIVRIATDEVTARMPWTWQVLPSWWQKPEEERNSLVKLIGWCANKKGMI